ncbi:MAG: M23 family metallopeptidase [Fibrobacter sp.]|nr:M23 family metallopeptidase [Fibrobacter sp.]
MKGKFYTIQIIPEDSNGIRKYRISTKWLLVGKILLVLLVAGIAVGIYNAGSVTKRLVHYENMRVNNAQLIKQNKNYEELFNRLDSIWVLEGRIQNILGTFVENDSNKINSLIDKNKFAHTPSEKIEVDYEGIHGWIPLDEKKRLERIPNVLPVVGIVSKKYSEDNEHLGTDFSAKSGNPIFASGSGVVLSAGRDGELGNTIVIDHKNGYVSSYSHLKEIRTKKGRTVNKGEVIGTNGETGNASGPHLHYSITKDGKPLDPESLFNY